MSLNSTIRTILVSLLCLVGALSPVYSAPLDIAENPLFLTTNVAPNVIVTLDDSGSMSRAFTPDLCGNPNGICTNNPDSSLDHRYVKSSHYNPIYYNPAVTYTPPVNAAGISLTTSFSSAWINGYATTLTLNGESSYNLATQYRPTAGMFLHSATKSHEFMNHYTAVNDLTTAAYSSHAHSGTMAGSNTGSNAPYFSITDFSDVDGTAGGNDPGGNVVTVTVAGTPASYVGTYTGTCDNDNDPGNEYEYKTQLSGTTLTLCFRDTAAMYGKAVVVTHKTALTSGSVAAGAKDPTAAYYYVFDETNAGCSGTAAQKKVDNDCYDLRLVTSTSGVDRDGNGSISAAEADERQNFANWYSFYRTRNLATIASASLAFAEFDSSTRVAWQSLNTCRNSTTSLVTTDCEGWETTSPNFSNAIKPFTGTHKQNFYTWLFRLNTNTSTPLREAMKRAGVYYSTTGDGSPYDDDLNTATSSPSQLSCRKNFHILMTDGIWNDSTPSGISTQDTGLAAPYGDTNSTSLADVAYHYWATDLTTGLSNNLLPYVAESGVEPGQSSNPKNDPATWQHMVNFTVGLGLTPFLTAAGLTYGDSNAATPDTYTGSYTAIAAGTTSWPSTSSDGGKVADLWHAAINSRGQFFSAESPDNLVTAFDAVKNAIEIATPSAAALAANSTSIQTGALVYQATFNSENWSGDLIAYPVGYEGAVGAAKWTASSMLPNASSRNIYTIDQSQAAGSKGIDFQWSSGITVTQKALLNMDASGNPDSLGSDRLGWLRGERCKEEVIVSGCTSTGTLRSRSKVLGDIINSDPAFAHADDFGYASLGAPEAATYSAYVTGKTNRIPAVFVGGNDGMLHAFRADASHADSGKELFAYVPNEVYSNLSALTDPAYAHRYYVDGGPTIGDAYLSSNWATVLVGGLGGGGNAVYALNVSNVSSPSASSMVMWEYTDTDLGLTYSKPQIARLANQWVAIFGNGYNSSSERAYLYVVDLETGTLVAKIAAGTATSNGLSTPALYDSDNDKIMDYAYAGDLQGNLWKFDLSTFADQTAPLFVAKNGSLQVQPITAQPVLGGHPSGGALIYFGTGQYLQSADLLNTQVQSFYAVWDSGSVATSLDRDDLQPQTIVAQVTGTYTVDDKGTVSTTDDETASYQLRETSGNTVDWSTQYGWYMDLNASTAERVVTQALLRYDRVVFLTVIPSTDTCDAGGESWLMELDAVTGAKTTVSSFDFNNDGDFDSGDVLANGSVASGIKTSVGITKPPAWFTGPDGKDYKVMTGTTGGLQSLGNKGGAPSLGGGTLRRVYWLQIQ